MPASITSATAALQTLGAFRLSIGDRELVAPPTQKARALLAYLVWNAGTEFSRERIIELFWPECEPERGRSSLNTALWSIRRSLRDGGEDAAAYVAADKTKVTWLVPVQLDAKEFERLAQRDDAGSKRDAIELYRGEFLEGNYDDWSVARRERADAAYQSLLTDAVESRSDVASAHRLIERGTFDEAPYVVVAQAEIAAGRPAVAAAIVERCRAALAELGTQPSQEFETRFAHVRSSGAARARRELALPFCGREEEMAALHQTFDRAAAGTGGVLLVQGVAGAGKSELLRQAQRLATDAGLNVVSVAAIENDPRAFGAWGALYAGVRGEASGSEGGASNIARAIVAAFDRPTALLVDDAQFFTGDALQVLFEIANAIAGRSIPLIVSTRVEGVRTLIARLPRHETLALAPLTFEQVQRAIEGLAGPRADALARFLHHRSGGHAFFAAQLFESLVTTRALRNDENTVVFDVPLDGLETPVTIRNFIESRLFSRGDDPATVACALALEAAATAEDLTAACGLGEDRTLDAIDDLLALGIIEQPAIGPQFRFEHDIVRETAARSLNNGRRAKIHRAFARLFEHDERREAPMQRARHLRASGQASAAAEAYRQAAYGYLEVNAGRDAIEAAMTGLEVCKRLRPSPAIHALMYRLLEIMMRSYEEMGDYPALLTHINAAIPHAKESKDPHLAVSGLVARAWTKSLALQDAHAGVPDLDEALAVARAAKDDYLISTVLSRKTHLAELLGEEKAALESAREALEAAERAADPFLVAHASITFLTGLAIWWHFDEAVPMAERALDAARAAGVRTELSARITRSELWYLLGRLEDTRRELDIVSGFIDSPNVDFSLPTGRGESVTNMRYRHRIQTALLALACENWDEMMPAAVDLASNALAKFENNRRIAEMIRAEALLGRDRPGDREEAYRIALAVSPPPPASAVSTVILLREVVLARAAARNRLAETPALLAEASRVLDAAIARMPLDGDRAYLALAASAREAGLDALGSEFSERGRALRDRRLAAGAGPASS